MTSSDQAKPSSSSSSSSSTRPIVAVIGTTGVGKSQLAVSLAQSLQSTPGPSNYHRSLVLSADSMQLYKGLDVITNKVTLEEMGGVEHWGLNVVQPGQGGSWELGRWCSEADKKVASMPREELPIICGGTHYFIQHFLFPPGELSFARTDREEEAAKAETKPDPLAIRWTPPGPKPPVSLDPELDALLDTFWTPCPVWPKDVIQAGQEDASPIAGPSNRPRPVAEDDAQLLAIWKLLEAVDPLEAGRWHWRDGRKVRRGLERWWERECARGGEVKEEEDGGVEGKDNKRRARFKTLVFWVYEPLGNLRSRLDRRVDRMVESGLLREIAELRGIAEKMYGSSDAVDHTEGIFQSIGYKEFAALSLPQADPASDPLFPAMLDRTKLSTHQYAKSQLRWIRKQLLPAVREAKALGGDVEVYVVPGGEAGEPIARDVLRAFLEGSECPDPRTVGHQDAANLLSMLDEEDTNVPDTAERQVLNLRRVCEDCSTPGRPFSVGVKDWAEHLKSKIHRRSVMGAISKEDRIAEAKAKGEAKRLEREKEKEEKERVKAKLAEAAQEAP